MSHYGRALYAEVLKLKGTLALRLTLIAPLVVVALVTLQWLLQRNSPVGKDATPESVWVDYTGAIVGIFTFLMLPLYITLQSALLAQLEHQDRQWKHLLALPLPRSSFYLAKLVVLALLVLLSMLLLALALIPLGGQLLQLRASIPFGGWPDVGALLQRLGEVYLCTSLLIALQTFIALRWKSFTVAVSIGMSATVMGFIIGQSPEFGPWFPWTMPMQPLTKHPAPEIVMLVSSIAALMVTVAAAVEFSRREFFD